MKPYYYIFKDPTYENNLVTYASYQRITDFPLGYRIGEGSAQQNNAMNQLLEIHNIYSRKNDTDLKSIKIPELPEPTLTYQLPEPEFIKLLIKRETRVNNGCIGFMRTRTAFNRLWNLNLSRVVEIYFKKYGYWVTREELLKQMKQYATEHDKMAQAISQKLAPEIKQLKDLYRNNSVLLDDLETKTVTLDLSNFDKRLESLEI